MILLLPRNRNHVLNFSKQVKTQSIIVEVTSKKVWHNISTINLVKWHPIWATR